MCRSPTPCLRQCLSFVHLPTPTQNYFEINVFVRPLDLNQTPGQTVRDFRIGTGPSNSTRISHPSERVRGTSDGVCRDFHERRVSGSRDGRRGVPHSSSSGRTFGVDLRLSPEKGSLKGSTVVVFRSGGLISQEIFFFFF